MGAKTMMTKRYALFTLRKSDIFKWIPKKEVPQLVAEYCDFWNNCNIQLQQGNNCQTNN